MNEQEQKKVLNFKPTAHPVYYCPSPAEIAALCEQKGHETVLKILEQRENDIKLEAGDPFRYGYEQDYWRDADAQLDARNELCVLGGNRSGKTEYAAKRAVQMFVGDGAKSCATPWPKWVTDRLERRGLIIWCLHTSSQTSISMQQSAFYRYLPTELKLAKKNKFTNIAYTQKNGFSDATAVYNRNQVFFLNYSQEMRVVEGGEPDLIWCDELIPQDWLETLRYRLVTRSGKLLVTFTPILGYTTTVKEFVATSKIIAHKPATLLPGSNVATVPAGHMPYIAEGRSGNHSVIWFHSQLNPYNNWKRMCDTLKGRSSHDIKIRAYGWADGTAGAQFPLFGQHNVISPDKVPKEGTNYFVCDPAGARNWFMLWVRVTQDGTHYVYREFPSIEYGEWTLPSEKHDGKPGPAQRAAAGRGIDDYSDLITQQLEFGEEIAERYIDPRAAGTETMSKEGGTTLLDLLATARYPLHFIPSASMTIDDRVMQINDLLSYDRSRDISLDNRPKLFVSEDCYNLVYSMNEWTGLDGQKGASKDPIDCLGYLVLMKPKHISSSSWFNDKQMMRGGSY